MGIFLGFGIAKGIDGGILLGEFLVVDNLGIAHDDATGIEVIVERLALAQEFGGEKEVEFLVAQFRRTGELQGIAHIEVAAITHRDGTLDDHHGIGVDRNHQVDDILNEMGVEEILYRIVVGGNGNDDEVGIAISTGAVEGCIKGGPTPTLP